MRSPSSSINLSQTLYNALRCDYVNHRAVAKRDLMPRALPDIAGIMAPDTETEEIAHGQ